MIEYKFVFKCKKMNKRNQIWNIYLNNFFTKNKMQVLFLYFVFEYIKSEEKKVKCDCNAQIEFNYLKIIKVVAMET